MADQAIINTSTLTSIGDAIRTKTGKTDTFLPSSMPEEILAIETGSDVSGVTAAASDVRSGKKFVNSSGAVVTGTVIARTSSSVTTSNNTVSIPAGIYDSAVSKTVGTAKAAATYTPGTSDQTISSGYYLTGTQTIKGDANLQSSNIASGISIFNVSGSAKVVQEFTIDMVSTSGDAIIITFPDQLTNSPRLCIYLSMENYWMYISDYNGASYYLVVAGGFGIDDNVAYWQDFETSGNTFTLNNIRSIIDGITFSPANAAGAWWI